MKTRPRRPRYTEQPLSEAARRPLHVPREDPSYFDPYSLAAPLDRGRYPRSARKADLAEQEGDFEG